MSQASLQLSGVASASRDCLVARHLNISETQMLVTS